MCIFVFISSVISEKLFFILLQKILDLSHSKNYSMDVATATSEASANTLPGSALALAPKNQGVLLIMANKQCLKPWAIARQLPSLKWVIIARYRSCSDANGHFLLLCQRVPNMHFKVVFDLLNCKE
jgi:hypothetical protein